MSALALALVLVSAVCHATWNLLAKRAGSEGVTFVWLMAACGMTLWLPVAVAVFVITGGVGWVDVVAFAGSAVLHTVYFTVLQRGYGRGDLSVVYPVARGTGPLLASVGAILLLGERPGAVGAAGIGFISAGVFVLAMPNVSGFRRRAGAHDGGRDGGTRFSRLTAGLGAPGIGLMYGLVTGLFIGGYTLWDGAAVGHWGVAPVLLMWTTDLGRSALLLPVVARDRARLRATWTRFRWYALGGGLLSPLSYILALTALRFSPITGVAPLREVSVLLGVLFGARLLAEGHLARRLTGAATIAAGAAAIAVG